MFNLPLYEIRVVPVVSKGKVAMLVRRHNPDGGFSLYLPSVSLMASVYLLRAGLG